MTLKDYITVEPLYPWERCSWPLEIGDWSFCIGLVQLGPAVVTTMMGDCLEQ